MTMRMFLRRHGPIVLGTCAFIALVASLMIVLFVRSSTALDRQLRETLRAAAVSAAFSIDGDSLRGIHGPGDMLSPEYVSTAALLRNIVDELPQARFAYILRRTDDPGVLEFVIDADASRPFAELDHNGNGTVDPDEEPSYPGEQYDITDMPSLHEDAFLGSTTDPEPTVDQWGLLLSGYAPIRSFTTGEVVAVVGIDMDAAEFRAYTRSILSPFAVIMILTLVGMLATGIALFAESRRLQVMSRMNSERSGLLQLTFHQLGEPITILQWGIETLEDAKSDPAQLNAILPENLSDMREGVRRLSSIIDTLQEAEKVELQVFHNEPVEQSPKRVITDAIALVDGKGRIVLDAPDEPSIFDPHLLTVVLRRLVENALEFSHEPSPVHVTATHHGRWLQIEITDTGCGIPAADLPHLFEKYRRASNAVTMKPDGNGLGLYIVKGIVELMHGQIHVDSVQGKGTTFIVQIPRHPLKRA